jgi:hypothetical protein
VLCSRGEAPLPAGYRRPQTSRFHIRRYSPRTTRASPTSALRNVSCAANGALHHPKAFSARRSAPEAARHFFGLLRVDCGMCCCGHVPHLVNRGFRRSLCCWGARECSTCKVACLDRCHRRPLGRVDPRYPQRRGDSNSNYQVNYQGPYKGRHPFMRGDGTRLCVDPEPDYA